MKNFFAVAVALSLLAVTDARQGFAAADLNVPLPGGYLNVDYYAGSGPNTIYWIIDFGNTGGQTHAFGYRYSGVKSAADGLYALRSAGPLTFSPPGTATNLFIEAFTYFLETDSPNNFDRTWSYFQKGTTPGQTAFELIENFGPSGVPFGSDTLVQPIVNGAFYGYRAENYNFNPITFQLDYINLQPPRLPVATPEPSAMILLAIGGVLLGVRRFRKVR